MRHLLLAASVAALSFSLAAPAIAQSASKKPSVVDVMKKVISVAEDISRDSKSTEASEYYVELTTASEAVSRAKDRVRDNYRNPVETLEFFQVSPQMKVGEYAPGDGWYSRMLGEYLGDEGQLVGLYFNVDETPFDDERKQKMRDAAAGFPAKAAEWTAKPASSFGGMTLDAVPEGEEGTYDRVLLVRMLHNLHRWNAADVELKAMRDLLKDDGMLGIVQHRAKETALTSYADGNKGYLRQTDVVKLVEAQGFELVGVSEVNANPKDMANHEKGVWELPPVLGTKKEENKAIGESDRMTLLFRKRP